ncbi:PQQ-binding-like beta-propeller repeat protein [Natronoglomus mannanivorans]|uniref:PQQ-binding-like beta-propeller repeat protein n=1 Tax=Natronoglomus mannanivorans TaxID=2979990 RepID=A0AAP2YXI2_9EURY|nr:PQQ-binding-like beta-propeller repeat protein [Halobacteria archaeon AArc-xg1-1]
MGSDRGERSGNVWSDILERRFDRRHVVAGLGAIAGFGLIWSLFGGGPTIDAGGAYPQSRYDARNTNHVPDDGPTSGVEVVWSRDDLTGTPIVGDGIVIPRFDDGVTALSQRDGETAWQASLDFASGGTVSAIVDGTVFVGTTEHGGTASGSGVYALTTDGTRRWHEPVGSVRTGPVVADGVVAVVTVPHPNADGPTTVHTLEVSSGEVRFRFEGSRAEDYTGLAIADGRLFVTCEETHQVHAIDLTDGTRQWQRGLTGKPSSVPVVGTERLYVVVEESDREDGTAVSGDLDSDYRIQAFDHDGKSAWETTVDHRNVTDLALSPEQLYVVAQRRMNTRNTELIAYDATSGSRNWSRDIYGIRTTPTSTPSVVCVGTTNGDDRNGRLYGLKPNTGETLWEHETPSRTDIDAVWSGRPRTPTIVNGHVYVGTLAGELYVLGPSSES